MLSLMSSADKQPACYCLPATAAAILQVLPTAACTGVENWDNPSMGCPGEKIWDFGRDQLKSKDATWGMAINPVSLRGQHQVRVNGTASCVNTSEGRGGAATSECHIAAWPHLVVYMGASKGASLASCRAHLAVTAEHCSAYT